MEKCGKLWAGSVYGTNTGNVFMELETSESGVTGILRFLDNQFGIALYHVAGTFDEKLVLFGTPANPEANAELGELTAGAELTPEGNLRGKWSTSHGTGGTFQAFPHDGHAEVNQEPPNRTPEQLYTANISLGAIRISAAAVDELVRFIVRDFVVGRPVLTYLVRGNEATKYFEDFKADTDVPAELHYLKINIQELEAHGINRVVIVELNARGQNVVRVQGINESWVIGKAEATARMLRAYEKALITSYKKFGLGLNQLMFLTMLVVMPSMPLMLDRAMFVVSVVALINALYWVHQRYIPNAVVVMRAEPSLFQRISPTVVSWLVGASASLAAALIYKWLVGAP